MNKDNECEILSTSWTAAECGKGLRGQREKENEGVVDGLLVWDLSFQFSSLALDI